MPPCNAIEGICVQVVLLTHHTPHQPVRIGPIWRTTLKTPLWPPRLPRRRLSVARYSIGPAPGARRRVPHSPARAREAQPEGCGELVDGLPGSGYLACAHAPGGGTR